MPMPTNRRTPPEPRDARSGPLELRVHRRYPIALAVQYKWNLEKSKAQIGFGTTINISRGGVLFRSSEMPPVRSPIELALSWPVSLDDCALKLVMRGRVVRTVSETTAVRIVHYEFRTAGARRRSSASAR